MSELWQINENDYRELLITKILSLFLSYDIGCTILKEMINTYSKHIQIVILIEMKKILESKDHLHENYENMGLSMYVDDATYENNEVKGHIYMLLGYFYKFIRQYYYSNSVRTNNLNFLKLYIAEKENYRKAIDLGNFDAIIQIITLYKLIYDEYPLGVHIGSLLESRVIDLDLPLINGNKIDVFFELEKYYTLLCDRDPKVHIFFNFAYFYQFRSKNGYTEDDYTDKILHLINKANEYRILDFKKARWIRWN